MKSHSLHICNASADSSSVHGKQSFRPRALAPDRPDERPFRHDVCRPKPEQQTSNWYVGGDVFEAEVVAPSLAWGELDSNPKLLDLVHDLLHVVEKLQVSLL